MGSCLDNLRINIEEENRWNNMLLGAKNASYRACLHYEYHRRPELKQPETFIFTKKRIDIAGAHYTLKSGINGLIKTGDINSGIIINDYFEIQDLKVILEHFISWAKDKNVSYVRINPWLPAKIDEKKTSYFEEFSNLFQETGFECINNGRNTYWIDLTSNEDQLLNQMRRKTRYDVRKGMKSGIKINEIQHADENIISKFWDFYNILGNKKFFNTLSESRFKNELRILLNSGFASLFVAEYNNEIINISMASRKGIASYMYGAINPDLTSSINCPPPGHFVQWSMIKTMKNYGLKIYDLGFCPENIPAKEHPEFNIWHFKYGFGGKFVQFMPNYGKIIKPVRGKIFHYLRKEFD